MTNRWNIQTNGRNIQANQTILTLGFLNELISAQAPTFTAIPHNLQPHRNAGGSAESDGFGDLV